VVAAVVVVNAMGDLWDPAAPLPAQPRWTGAAGAPAGLATTIGVVATNAVLTKTQCLLVAQSAHDGLARAIDPVHTGADGDAFVAAATGALEAPIDWVRALAARATEAAVRDALSGDPAGRRATRGA